MKNFKRTSVNFLKLAAPAAMLLSACGNTDLMDTNQNAAVSGDKVNATIQNVATCQMSKTLEGINVVCDGNVVGSLTNGKDGNDGLDGKDGVGCSMTELDDGIGYSVKCGDTKGVILNGTNGKDGLDGKNGTSCETSKIPDGSGIYVICGETAVAVLNGKDGKNGIDGTSCYAESADGEFDLYCGSKYIGTIKNGKDGKDGVDGKDGINGVDGIDGVDGKSCYAAPYEEGDDSGYSLYCADTLVGVILNGKNGADGKDGENGKDGTICNIAKVVGSKMLIACGSDTTEIEATINITNNYNNEKLEHTTFDPVIVYVSSSSEARPASSADVIISNSSSSFEYNVDMGVVTGSCSVQNGSNWCREYYDFNNGWIYECGTHINKGDSITWTFNSDASNSVDELLASVFIWDFEGSSVASYEAQGLAGAHPPKVAYTVRGTYNTKLSINGGDSFNCSTSVIVDPSPIKNCVCAKDESNSTPSTTAWKLQNCSSFEPFIKYTWSGVESTSENGLLAYTPANTDEESSVKVLNADSVEVDVYCGSANASVIEYQQNSDGLYFSTEIVLEEGTHDLTYNCGNSYFDDDIRFTPSEGGQGHWISSTLKTGEINNDHYVSYSNFGSTKSRFVVTVESGTITVSCDQCKHGSLCNEYEGGH